jgi:L-threonylcarbamoyladenylate synthase
MRRFKVFKLTIKNFARLLSLAEKSVRAGKIIVGPTDTVYGIFGDARKPEVIRKIFALKGRIAEKSLPVFVKDIPSARKLAYISDNKAKFLGKIWPGGTTVVFHHKEKLPKILTGGKETIALRIPDHLFLLKLLERLDFPLVQTSANLSGKPPARNIEDIRSYFQKSKIKIDLIIDGGEMEIRPSTVVDFTGAWPVILRTGIISKEELDAFFLSVREAN